MNARRPNFPILLSLVVNVAILIAVAPSSYAVPVSASALFDAGANTGGFPLPISVNRGATGNISGLFGLPFDSISGAFYSPNGSQLIGSGADVSVINLFNLLLFDAFSTPFDAQPLTYASWLVAMQSRTIPEPTFLLLVGFGLLVSAVWVRRHYQAPQESESHPSVLFEEPAGGNMKTILLVDDNSTLRHLMSLTLESMGYKPITAANGNEGVEKAIFSKPDLMLLDVMLPDIDGPQVAKILRHEPATKDIPIIAISAAFRASVRQDCLTAGCNDFIVKPFTSELLGEKLRSFMTIL